MKVDIRIVAGSLRGRKLTCTVNPNLRPTPHMAREALFSILGDAVPGRAFYDVFAGTGVNGMEALSRGASSAVFLERDFRLVDELERHLKEFKLRDSSRTLRADVYRWAERWSPPADPVNVFLSPPFADLEGKPGELLGMVRVMQEKLAPNSVLVLQVEACPMLAELPEREAWDERKYGRNLLYFWVKPTPVVSREGEPPVTGEEAPGPS